MCSMNVGIEKSPLKFSPRRKQGKKQPEDTILHRIILKQIKNKVQRRVPQFTDLGVP